MSQSTSDQLKLIDVRKPLLRALLVVPVLLALLFSWYATRWYMGNFVAEFAPRMQEGQLDAALAAMRLAPDDPWTHGAVASLKKGSLLPEELADAVHHYEEAVRLSPNDYRFWLELGRAREQSGDSAGGEKALRRAVELAPSYAYPRWHLGNLLLRAGRGEEAFAELRRASDAASTLRPQMFNVAWSLYGQNIDEIKRAVGDSAATRAEFAIYLVGRARPDDALALWSSLQPAEKRAQREAGEAIMKSLLAQKRYRAAVSILSDLSTEGASPKAAQFINGGFEEDINTSGTNVFSWQIKSDPQAQIVIDGSTRHSGARSLRILFKVSSSLSFNNIAQLVSVEPSAQYRFECYVRAEDLKSAGTPAIEIVDATDGTTVLAVLPPIPVGTYDWQPVAINFKTPPQTEAVTVRIVRSTCSADAVCPIFGMVWYDDFNLQHVGGAASPRDSRGATKART
ncbi:MAG: tetratricopeptide repeat protein [Acidobacteria bacterium]|nr:tetratricopeptide repeat protein [Acidobacteriota bacterium]